MPNLRAVNARPTVAPTTTSEVSDEAVGLPFDPVAQTQAERFVRAAIAYHRHQAAKAEKAARRSLKPVSTLIALPADDEDESPAVAAVDVLSAEMSTPRSWADEGH